MSLTGQILRSRTVSALTTPHGIDRYLKQINPMWAAHEVRGRIVDIRPETADTATITLQPTESWRGHKPGQHVSVGVEIGGRRLTRVFTISSAESRPGERFTLTVRSTDSEPSVSRFLVKEARRGTLVELSQAEGDFVLPDQVPEHIVFISGGSGITPVMAMLRSLQLRTHRGRITFLHWSHAPEQQIFAAELEDVRRSGYGVDVHLLHPGQGDPYLSPALLEKLVPGYQDLSAWACGPQSLIEAAQAAWVSTSSTTGQVQVEWFKPPRREPTGATSGEVSFARSGTARPNDGAVLLEQAEAAGLKPEFGCRMGICFSCTATKTSGVVRNILTGETSTDTEEEIRICVSTPEGDCSIDL